MTTTSVNPIAETSCAKCGQKYLFNLETADPHCPKCGCSALPQQVSTPSVSKRNFTIGWPIFAIVVIGVVGLLIKSALHPTPAQRHHETDDPQNAWFAVKNSIAAELPDKNAVFDLPSEGSREAGFALQKDGSVDAWGRIRTVNSFNAPIFKNWRAHLSPNGPDQWTINEVKFTDP
jgi:hypothetical protein